MTSVILFCFYDLLRIIPIAQTQGLPQRHASTRPRHALQLTLPVSRHGADILPRPLFAVVCNNLRALSRPSYAGGGLPDDTAAAVGLPTPLRRLAPCLLKTSACQDPRPLDTLPATTACEPIDDGDCSRRGPAQLPTRGQTRHCRRPPDRTGATTGSGQAHLPFYLSSFTRRACGC